MTGANKMAADADIATMERLLQAAQHKADITEAAAVTAMQEALEAKCNSLMAWVRLAKARGSTDDFRLAYQEAVILTSRKSRGCEAIVRSALRVGLLARLGLTTS